MPRLLSTLPLIALLTIGTAIQAQDESTTTGETAVEESTDSGTDTGAGAQADSGAQEADTTTDDAAEAAEETEETSETAEGEATGTEGDPDLDMGRDIEEDPSYIKEQYGDWQLQCFKSEAEEDPCQMYQLLREEAGNPVAEFSLFKLPSSSQAVAGAMIVVPLGTLLPEGLKISVDGGKAKSYNFSFCSMVGCFARIGFTEGDIGTFRAGVKATLTIVPAQAPDQKVNIETSLDGFTAAYNNVSVAPQNPN